MKIAVACEGKQITEHFGHCQNFMIFEVENNKIINSNSVPNPGHKPGFLPNFLNDIGTNVIISGGMGGGAVDIFNKLNIEVVTGARQCRSCCRKHLSEPQVYWFRLPRTSTQR